MTEITVHGLHQWDYGRKLEIKSSSLAGRTVVEVHFANAGMERAVVRTCAVSTQSVTASIPDICLTQSAPICAWVFIPDGDEGFTVLKITLPVAARTQPAEMSTEPPEDYNNQYLEVIRAANAVIENTYSKSDIEAALGVYITELDTLLGGGA